MAGAMTRRALDRLADQLEPAYQDMLPVWQEAVSLTRPTRAKWFAHPTRTDRRNPRVLRPIARSAGNIAEAGMQHGTASPARPWISLGVDALRPTPLVTEWLEEFTDALLLMFERSNLYDQMAATGRDALDVGTGAMAAWDDDETLSRFESLPIGSYRLGNDRTGRVNAITRSWTMTVAEAAEQWGKEQLSAASQQELQRGNYGTKLTIRHRIAPTSAWPAWDDPHRNLEAFPWREVYWEGPDATTGGRRDGQDESGVAIRVGDGVLGRGGYHEFPVLVDRWSRASDDEYGVSSPGIDTLGLNGCLQSMERMYLEAVEKMNAPPIVGGPGLEDSPVSTLARALTIDTQATGKETLARPLFEVRTPVQYLDEHQERYAREIRDLYYVDLFVMFAGDQRADARTAREIAAKLGEKSAMLGPVLQRRYDGFVAPLVERASGQMIRRAQEWWDRGQDAPFLRQPPEALAGSRIRVKFTSEIAEALKLAGLAPIERHMAYRLELGQQLPSALDGARAKIDALLEEHARLSGVPQRLIATADELLAIRRADAQAAQRQQRIQEVESSARATRDLAAAQVGDGNALEAMVAEGSS